MISFFYFNSYPIKKIINILAIAGLLLTIHVSTKAQVIPVLASNVAYANITCVVVSPIVITKLRDMHFGNIVSGSKGTILLPSDGGKPISTGSAGIPNAANTTSTATFEISDNLGNNPNTVRMFTEYTITLPTNDVVLVNEEGKTMRVGNFTSNPASTQKGTLVNGIGQLSVGATLYIEADQGLGQYATASPFPVTVNFN